MEDEIIIFWIKLSDTYAGVGPKPIQHLVGFENADEGHQSAINKVNMEGGGQIHWLEGNKIFLYIKKNLRKHCNDIITFFLPRLKLVYIKNKKQFPEEQ